MYTLHAVVHLIELIWESYPKKVFAKDRTLLLRALKTLVDEPPLEATRQPQRALIDLLKAQISEMDENEPDGVDFHRLLKTAKALKAVL